MHTTYNVLNVVTIFLLFTVIEDYLSLWNRFRESNKTVKLKDLNINCRSEKDEITRVLELCGFNLPK